MENGKPSKGKIADNQSFKDLDQDFRNFKVMRSVFRFARPILKFVGVDTKAMEESISKMDDLEGDIPDFLSFPDRFNDAMAEHGWILYELMNLDVAKAAFQAAEAADFIEATRILVEYYDADTVAFHLNQMKAISAFGSRWGLAEKARIDYMEGRFHASIPVTLLIIDGLVSELHERQRGLSASDAEIEAWDSISAHSAGIGELLAHFRKGRKKTTTDPISFPFRHGIMHGRDLGYDNKEVAAKCWALLFSLRDWALKAERNELGPKPAPEPTTLRELYSLLLHTADTKRKMQDWKPRDLTAGVDFPVSGNADEYEQYSPEKAAVEFLELWMKKNYGHMADRLKLNEEISPRFVRDRISDKELIAFQIKNVRDVAPIVSEIDVVLRVVENGTVREVMKTFRLLREGETRKPKFRDDPGGRWKFAMPFQILEGLW